MVCLVYTSPNIQNDLLAIMADMVSSHITSAVRDSGMFSILVDESKDLSKKFLQLCYAVSISQHILCMNTS